MVIEYSRGTVELVFPDGIAPAADKAIKAGDWAVLPEGTRLRIVKRGPTPAEHQAADLEREAAEKAARKSARVTP